MNKIIVISGKQYSGKDTFAAILLEKMNDFKRIGIGDAIKIEYAKQKNLTLDEIIKNKHLYRNDLIKLGDWGRSQDDDYWLNNLANMDKIIVPDVRVNHEVEYFKSKGAFLIRVNSSYENRSIRGIITNEDDPTETALDGYKNWNLIVDNNSDLDYLYQIANEAIEKFNSFIKL